MASAEPIQSFPDADPHEFHPGEVPDESVGPGLIAERMTAELRDPNNQNNVYPIVDVNGEKYVITPELADESVHDPETGLNFFHRNGKKLAVGGAIGAAILLGIGTARVIDKKRQK